jgi:pimeloyl-ACP methyl ester carboxylesterase
MGERPTQGTSGAGDSSRPAKILAGSLFSGLAAAVALVLIPFSGARESAITGAILLGFSFGWAMLALLSARFTARPQRWALVPAAAMALTAAGLLVLAPGEAALTTLGWVWPPALLALVVWMVVQARRQLPSRARRWLLYPVFGVLALAAIGGGFETLRDSTDHVAADVAGDRLIDVGGHRLHIRCTGAGSPTVVLEPGLGESASAMGRWIAPDVARATRVCVYDHAGHGRSEAAPGNHADAARDLHVLLRRGQVPGPYIVAGHSLGGMFALSYAHRYPAEIAGVVLLDSMHPTQSDAFAGMDPVLAVLPTLARTGLGRIFVDPKEGKPTVQVAQFVRDVADMPAELARAAQLTSLGDRPLAVVTAGSGSQSGWLEQQNKLAALSSKSIHRVVAGSTHASLIDDKRDAARSSQAIREVVRAARSGRR